MAQREGIYQASGALRHWKTTLNLNDTVVSVERARLGRCRSAPSPVGRSARGVTQWWAVSTAPEGVWRGRQPLRPGRARSPGAEWFRLYVEFRIMWS
jgi:hypothetical protein